MPSGLNAAVLNLRTLFTEAIDRSIQDCDKKGLNDLAKLLKLTKNHILSHYSTQDLTTEKLRSEFLNAAAQETDASLQHRLGTVLLRILGQLEEDKRQSQRDGPSMIAA